MTSFVKKLKWEEFFFKSKNKWTVFKNKTIKILKQVTFLLFNVSTIADDMTAQ